MKWIVIVVVLLAAFGPVLWLVPSRRDRQQAAMRTRARQRGLIVAMTSIADPDPLPQARVSAGGKLREPLIAGASYELTLPRPTPLAPTYALIRRHGQVASPIAGWQIIADPAAMKDASAQFVTHLATIVDRLPADVISCSGTARSVACFWRERIGEQAPEAAVDELADCLTELANLQRTHDVAQEAAREAERALESVERPRSSPPSS